MSEAAHEDLSMLEARFEKMSERHDLSDRFLRAITALNYQQLGRPITGTTTLRQLREEEAAPSVIGNVLPIDAENAQHLHIFATGDMIITEAALPNNPGKLRDYQDQHSPSLVPIRVEVTGNLDEDVRGHINNLRMHGLTHNIRVISMNTDPLHASNFQQALRDALETARATAARREQLKRESMNFLVDGLEGLAGFRY